MSQFDISKLPQGPKGFVHDLGSDQRVFKGVPWGKAMMWKRRMLTCMKVRKA